MKADIKNITEANRIASYRKEKGFFREVMAIDPADGSKIVSARFYFIGRDGMSPVYCCMWIMGNSVYGRGAGKAGGCGYHKESAALDSAIRDAGIELSEPIDGVGDSAIRDAIMAIARAVTGKRKIYYIQAHA